MQIPSRLAHGERIKEEGGVFLLTRHSSRGSGAAPPFHSLLRALVVFRQCVVQKTIPAPLDSANPSSCQCLGRRTHERVVGARDWRSAPPAPPAAAPEPQGLPPRRPKESNCSWKGRAEGGMLHSNIFAASLALQRGLALRRRACLLHPMKRDAHNQPARRRPSMQRRTCAPSKQPAVAGRNRGRRCRDESSAGAWISAWRRHGGDRPMVCSPRDVFDRESAGKEAAASRKSLAKKKDTLFPQIQPNGTYTWNPHVSQNSESGMSAVQRRSPSARRLLLRASRPAHALPSTEVRRPMEVSLQLTPEMLRSC